jgi:hypothetical protein
MPLHTLGKLLGATDELRALQVRTRWLLELQTLYFRSAPRELARFSRVKGYRAGMLIVSAADPAIAAKLKQLAPRLLRCIQKCEKEVTSVRIEVQVNTPAAEQRVKATLTVDAVAKFDALAHRVGNENLKLALANLVSRHGGRTP